MEKGCEPKEENLGCMQGLCCEQMDAWSSRQLCRVLRETGEDLC